MATDVCRNQTSSEPYALATLFGSNKNSDGNTAPNWNPALIFMGNLCSEFSDRQELTGLLLGDLDLEIVDSE
jgi:hypothetical protein